MTVAAPVALWPAYVSTLAALGRTDPTVHVVQAGTDPAENTGALEEAFGARWIRLNDPSGGAIVSAAAELARTDRAVFANARTSEVVRAYGVVRQALGYEGANVKLVARAPWPISRSEGGVAPAVEDVGLMRGIPGMAVVVPADAACIPSVVHALLGIRGPAYVRVAEGSHPPLTDGAFTLGRAGLLREGSDLAIVGAGPILGAAVALADELKQVGTHARVLDLGSVKPIDAPALLRAARDTGGILVVEEHTVETGLGELVAGIVAENFAVPVRRVGVPDLFEAPPGPHGALGPAADRLRDEAWELLRLRGKVQ